MDAEYWFHVFVLKHVFKSRTAGLPGFPPFRTVHHSDIAPQKLEAWAQQNGLELLLYTAYESSRRGGVGGKIPVHRISVGHGLSRPETSSAARHSMQAIISLS